MMYCRAQAWPLERMNRSRPSQSGFEGEKFITYQEHQTEKKERELVRDKISAISVQKDPCSNISRAMHHPTVGVKKNNHGKSYGDTAYQDIPKRCPGNRVSMGWCIYHSSRQKQLSHNTNKGVYCSSPRQQIHLFR